MEWISKLLDINKIPTKIIFLVWIISTLLLFLSDELITQLSLTSFKQDYGKYAGITFLGTSGLLILFCITWITNSIQNARLNSKYKKIILQSLNELDLHEQSVLREFYIQGKSTLKIPLDNPTVSGLINKRIIYQVSSYGQMSVVGMLFNFSISDIARENINLEQIGLPAGTPTESDIKRIGDSRPQWMLTLESKQRMMDSLW